MNRWTVRDKRRGSQDKLISKIIKLQNERNDDFWIIFLLRSKIGSLTGIELDWFLSCDKMEKKIEFEFSGHGEKLSKND